ncbi:MAG TPA: sugar ABC transporter permease, partial [Arthrobacter sp.]
MNGSAANTVTPAAPAGADDAAPESITDVEQLKALKRRRPFGVWFKDKGWRHLVGVAVTIFAIFPLLYVLSAAFNSTGTLVGSNALFSRIDFGNFTELFNNPARPYGRWFVNTMVVGVVTSAATV